MEDETCVQGAKTRGTASRYRIAENQRAVMVKPEFTNLGPNPYGTTPDPYLVLIDDRLSSIRKSIAILRDCPSCPMGDVAPGATVSGCSVYEVAKAAPVVAVQWSSRPDLTDRTLTWRLR